MRLDEPRRSCPNHLLPQSLKAEERTSGGPTEGGVNMRVNPTVLRLLIVLAFSPSTLIVLHSVWQAKEEQAAARHDADSYDNIALFSTAFEVTRLLGGNGSDFSDARWPQVVGDLPGC